jgi:hypothetical protein
MIIDMFELPPMDDEMMRDLAEIEMVRATARRKEALQLFYRLSRDFRDAFSDLELVVLKPLCTSCANQRSIGLGSSGKTSIVMVLPGYRPEQFRMYDRSSHLLHFFPYERDEDEERFRVTCKHCGDYADQGNEDGDELIAVEPESFCEYFGVEDEGPKKAAGDLREEIRALYGNICFRCGEKRIDEMTVDHIVPKSAEGVAVPTNLQLLCKKCNGEKADQTPERLVLALDFLMRPAPWDSYEGLIW